MILGWPTGRPSAAVFSPTGRTVPILSGATARSGEERGVRRAPSKPGSFHRRALSVPETAMPVSGAARPGSDAGWRPAFRGRGAPLPASRFSLPNVRKREPIALHGKRCSERAFFACLERPASSLTDRRFSCPQPRRRPCGGPGPSATWDRWWFPSPQRSSRRLSS